MIKDISQLSGLSESRVRKMRDEGLITFTTMRDYLISQFIKAEKSKGRVQQDILYDVSVDPKWGVCFSTAYNIAKRLG